MRCIFIAFLFCVLLSPSLAQGTEKDSIKIGDIYSYTGLAYFAEPYKKGWQMALQEINHNGGVLGRPLEVVSRDSRGNPGDAVTAANELIHAEEVFALMGTDYSHIGLAVSEVAKHEEVPLVASIAGTNKLLWEKGHPYVFRVYWGTDMLVSLLSEKAAALPAQKWGIVASNYEGGISLAEGFKTKLKAQRPDIEFVVEQYPALNKIEAGSVIQTVKRAEPEALFVFLLGSDLVSFVRESKIRGLEDIQVVSESVGLPEEQEKFGTEYPQGWIVSSIPQRNDAGPLYQDFYEEYLKTYGEEPGLNSVLGYLVLKSIAAGIEKAGMLDREAFIKAMNKIKVPFMKEPLSFREIDGQSNMGLISGKTSVIDGEAAIIDRVYEPAEKYLAPDEKIRKLRGEAR